MRVFLITIALALCARSAPTAENDGIFEPGAKLKVEIANGAGGEGPAWDPKLGLLTTGEDESIWQLDPAGKSRLWRKGAGANGLLFDAQGRLLCCEPVQRRMTRLDPPPPPLAKGGMGGWKLTVLTDNYQGKRYNQPNDVTVDSQGRIYFSDPRYGPRDDMQIRDEQGRTIEGVYRIDPPSPPLEKGGNPDAPPVEKGGQGGWKVTRILGREVDRPNGLLVSEDDRYLFVADNNNSTKEGARKLWRFDLKKDGTVELASRKLLYDWGLGRGPDGVKQDQKGRLYVAGGLNKPNPPAEPAEDVKGGIYVIDPRAGKLLAFLSVPRDEVTNCAFGGDDLRTLYITAGGTIYSIRTTTPGRVVWPR